MQGVKANTTTIGVENRVRQEMIKINEYCR